MIFIVEFDPKQVIDFFGFATKGGQRPSDNTTAAPACIHSLEFRPWRKYLTNTLGGMINNGLGNVAVNWTSWHMTSSSPFASNTECSGRSNGSQIDKPRGCGADGGSDFR